MDTDPSSELEEVVHFVNDYFATEDEQDTEFDAWICDLMNTIDQNTFDDKNEKLPTPYTTYHSSQSGYHLKFSIRDLQQAMQEMMVHNANNIVQHLLIDPGAPRSICSEEWLRNSSWIPVKKLPLPADFHPLRFAGHGIYPKHAVCLIARLQDIHGQPHLFRQVVFVLPPTPIPCLVGPQVQRSMSFDLCMSQGQDSYLKIHSWESTHNLVVNSHVWLLFSPIQKDPDPNFDWNPLIKTAFTIPAAHMSHFSSFPVEHRQSQPLSPNPTETNLPHIHTVLPWEKDDWKSKLNPNNLDHLHDVLRHPQPNSMLNLFRQQHGGRRVPKAIRDHIYRKQQECRPCQENAELPRVPKVSMPPGYS